MESKSSHTSGTWSRVTCFWTPRQGPHIQTVQGECNPLKLRIFESQPKNGGSCHYIGYLDRNMINTMFEHCHVNALFNWIVGPIAFKLKLSDIYELRGSMRLILIGMDDLFVGPTMKFQKRCYTVLCISCNRESQLLQMWFTNEVWNSVWIRSSFTPKLSHFKKC